MAFALDCCIVLDEEGKLKGLPYNMTFCGVDFVGPVLFVGVDGEEFTDLTQKQAEIITKLHVERNIGLYGR